MKNIMPPEHKGRIMSYIIAGASLIAIYTLASNISPLWSGVMRFITCLRPFLIGIVLALLEFPIARGMEGFLFRTLFRRRPASKFPRVIATFVALFVLIGLVAVFFSIILPEVVRSILSLKDTVGAFIDVNATHINSLIKQYDIPFLTINNETLTIAWEDLLTELTSYTSVILSNIMSIGTAIYRVVFQLFVGIITSLYLMLDRDRLCATFKKLTFSMFDTDTANIIVRWTRRAGDIFVGFVSGKAVDSLIMGILCYICMLMFRYEYALLISTVIGLTNMIPFFGPFIGALPSVLILAIVNPYHALGFLIFIVILQQIDGNVIGPWILGDYLGLGPLWIMMAIVVGSGMYGFTGMMLSIPVFALVYGMIQEYSAYRLRQRGLPETTDGYLSFPPKEEKKKRVSRLPWNRIGKKKSKE